MKFPEKGRPPSPIEHSPSARYLPILRVVTLYILFASLWILLSDKLAEQLFPRLDEFQHAQTYKGMAFVSASGALIR